MVDETFEYKTMTEERKKQNDAIEEKASRNVRRLKGNTSRRARQTFSDLQYLGYKMHYKQFPFLWARGYYIGSAGHVSQDAVKRYIMEQQGKDVFAFSVYGNKEQKIGDFTQEKLF